MEKLIELWYGFIKNGTKSLDDVPSKIKIGVIKRLNEDGAISESDLANVKDGKISEMSNMCNQIIVAGFDIVLSDNVSYHFSLEVTDQLKIATLADRAESGSTVLPYHADGELCRFYSAEDISAINTKMEYMIEYHTTYFNSLRDYIKSLTDIDTILVIEYGVDIPSEFQSEVLTALLAQVSE